MESCIKDNDEAIMEPATILSANMKIGQRVQEGSKTVQEDQHNIHCCPQLLYLVHKYIVEN